MKFSKKRLLKNTEYNKLRKEFFLEPGNEFCKARLPGCFVNATDVHHCFSGSNRDTYFLDTTTWISTCRNCHFILHNVLSEKESIALGLKCKEEFEI